MKMISTFNLPFSTWCVVLSAIVTSSIGKHFRGGTISWKSVGGREVEFFFKLGWTHGRGPGCNDGVIGQFVSAAKNDAQYWKCCKGCGSEELMATTDYYCMSADVKENFEQGQNRFNYTFPGLGTQFVVGFNGGAWMVLSAAGKGDGNWRLATAVDIRIRNDTGRPNSSPVSLSQSLYYLQLDCHHEFHIPVIDADNDNVRCRQAVGDECVSVCNALPGAVLNETTCTISFDPTYANLYKENGDYVVALTIEDYPPSTIQLDGTDTKTPLDSLSSIPLQFLVKTPKFPVPCVSKPRFITPTPAEDSRFLVDAGDIFSVDVVVDNQNDTSTKIRAINVQRPLGVQLTQMTAHPNLMNTFQITLTWQTAYHDTGKHIVCATASDERGKTSDQRCFTITIVPDPCFSHSCQNNGTCIHSKGNATCQCPPGFTGNTCNTTVVSSTTTDSRVMRASSKKDSTGSWSSIFLIALLLIGAGAAIMGYMLMPFGKKRSHTEDEKRDLLETVHYEDDVHEKEQQTGDEEQPADNAVQLADNEE